MFEFNQEEAIYQLNIHNVIYECDHPTSTLLNKAIDISEVFDSKFNEILDCIYQRYLKEKGSITKDELLSKLGPATINLDKNNISYLEHDFFNLNAIAVRFSGILESFDDVIIV